MKITLRINSIPVAQKRARSRAIPKNGKWIATTYKDSKQRQQEDNLQALLYPHAPEQLMTGPLILDVIVFLPIPKSRSKKWQASAENRDIMHTTKPDLDNLLKHLKDCLKGIFYEDDRQIFAVHAKKFYSYHPRWEIIIEEASL